MSELMMDVVTSVVAMIVGFGIGQVVAWRRAEIGGREFIVPTAHPGPRTAKIAAFLLVVIATTSMVSGVVTQNQVEECNANFREILKARSAGTSEQFDAITELQMALVEADPTSAGEADRFAARRAYLERVEEIEAYRASHPYPDTEC